MAALKPFYLISGDDDPRIDAWRARVRARAEAEGGAGALERFDARESSPADVAGAAASLTLGGDTRYLLVDGVEAWKAGELEPLEQALSSPEPDTIVVLLVRGKPLDRLRKAVEDAGGEVREHLAPKQSQLPRWVVERAREQGLALEPEAAKALVEAVGKRPARLEREVERLALAVHPAARVSATEVSDLVTKTGAGVYALADALVSGHRQRTLELAEDLIARDPRPGALTFPLARRLREVQSIMRLLDGGLSERSVAASLSAPPWAAKRTIAQARTASRDRVERALCAFADLEVRTRSGDGLDEATELSLTLVRATA